MIPTLQQIADKAGVSPMTVSRTLRGVGRVGDKTRQRVRETAREMGYQKSQGVLILPPIRRGKADHQLQLFGPTICQSLNLVGKWYLNRLVDGLNERLKLSNGQFHQKNYDNLEDLLEEWKSGAYHGLILREILPKSWIQKLKQYGPVVYAVAFDFHEDVDCVYGNEFRATSTLLEKIKQQGHKQIAWLGILDHHSPYHNIVEDQNTNDVSESLINSVHHVRFATWSKFAYCPNQPQYQPLVLMNRDWRTQSHEDVIRQGIEQILSHQPQPTAIVCVTGLAARVAIKVLNKKGLDVPGDISLVGYGDYDLSQPDDEVLPLSTMGNPMKTLGRIIPELIERRLANPDALPVSMQFEMPWIEGKTLAPPKRIDQLKMLKKEIL